MPVCAHNRVTGHRINAGNKNPQSLKRAFEASDLKTCLNMTLFTDRRLPAKNR